MRFQGASEESTAAADSGVESVASNSADRSGDGAGRNRENWLKRLTEQRQLYYDNVHQLLNFMKNRQELPRSSSSSISTHQHQCQRPSPRPQEHTVVDHSRVVHSQPQQSPSPVVQLNLSPAQPQTETSSAHSFPSNPTSAASHSNYSLPNGAVFTAPAQPNHPPPQFYSAVPTAAGQQGPFYPPPMAMPQQGPYPAQPSEGYYMQYQPTRPQYATQQAAYQFTNFVPPQPSPPQATGGTSTPGNPSTTNQTSRSAVNSPPSQQSKSTSTSVRDRRTQTERSSTSSPAPSFRPSVEEVGTLPAQLQAWIRRSEEELRSLKEENAELRIRADELEEKSHEAEDSSRRLQEELDDRIRAQEETAESKIKSLERELALERNKLQQLRMDIADADGNSATLTKKYIERCSELDKARERCTELEEKEVALEEQLSKLQSQLRSLKVSVHHIW